MAMVAFFPHSSFVLSPRNSGENTAVVIEQACGIQNRDDIAEFQGKGDRHQAVGQDRQHPWKYLVGIFDARQQHAGCHADQAQRYGNHQIKACGKERGKARCGLIFTGNHALYIVLAGGISQRTHEEPA